MMGYLKPLTPDARIRSLYRSYQCGLCHTIGADYGFTYRLLAGPDLVFYNIFLDLVAGTEAPLSHRACVLGPGVTSLPARERTDHTGLAAAFGVYMAVAKLEDNWRDDGGLHRWLAWRAFLPGQRRARRVLEAADFPVAELDGWMARQAQLEAAGGGGLVEASEPTRAISSLSFGFAARHADEFAQAQARALGDALGAYLFYVDNLLDVRRDLDAGGYNALAAAFSLQGPTAVVPEAAYAAGVAGAHAAVGVLEPLVAAFPAGEPRRYLHETLVRGFRDKLVRFRRLPSARRGAATLRSVSPPTLGVIQGVRHAARRPTQLALARVQVLVALFLMWMFPKRAWANDWWPQDTGAIGLDTDDTGDTSDTGRDTGFDTPVDSPVDTGSPDPGDRSALSEWLCNPCVSNCGFQECDPVRGCENLCSDACSTSCEAACGDACDGACDGVDCSPDCSC